MQAVRGAVGVVGGLCLVSLGCGSSVGKGAGAGGTGGGAAGVGGAAGIAGSFASGGRGGAGGSKGVGGRAGDGSAAAGESGGNGGTEGGTAGTGGSAGAAGGAAGSAGNVGGGNGGSAAGTGGSAGAAGGAAGSAGKAGGGNGGSAAGTAGSPGAAGTDGTGDGGGGTTDAAADSGASDDAMDAAPDGPGDGGDAGSGPDGSSCWIGDFDGDRTPDCAIAGPGPTDVSFFKGFGGGAYAGTPVVTPSILPAGFVLLTAPLDMTAEGRDDLVFEAVTNRVDLVLLTGEADGTFGRVPRSTTNLCQCAQVPALRLPAAPIGIIGHFDSSGKNELFLPVFASGGLLGENPQVSWAVFYADDTNTPQATISYGLSNSGQNLVDSIVASGAVGDVNGDQILDGIAIIHFLTSQMGTGPGFQDVEIAVGNGDRTFQPAKYVPGTIGATSVQAEDVNQDGNLDLLVDVPAGPTTFYGDGTGHFSTSAP